MSSANEITETFQHYQVLRKPDGTLWELGRGAMGITYKAFDTNLRCDVALKVINALHLDSETARARFLREARAAAGLRHRNVASVYHLGNDDQSFFYAMEFVDGETIECLVKETGPMPTIDALRIIIQVARALSAAAKQNLVHRDIKPANVMVTREEDEEEEFVVKVIDFGLARPAIGGEGSAHITMGGFVGTPQFASPEQLEEKDLDARSDIYSLGVTLWFMLAGRPPFTGPLGSVFIQQLTKDPPWAQLEGLPAPVLALLAEMLEKDPEKRPQTPVDLRRKVEACVRALPETDRLASSAKVSAADTLTGSVTGSETPATQATPGWTVGGVLADRFELTALVGDGSNGRVFCAQDRRRENAVVAVKILHRDVLASSAERRRLEGELDKLRTAPHPYLIDFTALQESADTAFLVGEWVNGFTLVDLLRTRGQLPLAETLRLVAQASIAADHARANDLRRLELSLHQIMTAFDESGFDTRTALSMTLDKWPQFSLKLDALGIAREAGDSVTWGGDQTLMPAALLGRDTQTSIRGFVEGSDLFSLGLMTYELLSGAPPAHSQRAGGREARYVALPALNEAANLVLRKALSPNPGFGGNVEFFKALVDASGLPQTFLDAEALAQHETISVERLPVSGPGADDLGATLVLEDGESISPVEMRGPSAEERAAAERAEAERQAQDRARVEAEREEARRLAAERAEAQRIEAERLAAERAEAERIAAERTEAERIAAEQAKEDRRIAAEARRREEERLAAERAEAERIEKERVAAERAEAKRLADERAEAARLEKERVAAQRAEEARIEKERRAAERAQAERIAAEKAEAQRIEEERLAAERAEAKRVQAEKARAERAEADRIAAEKAKAQRIEEERLAAERAEAKRAQAEKARAEKAEADRIKAEKAEEKRLEAERIKAEKAEAARLKEKADEERRAQEARLKAERAEAARLEAEKAAAAKAEAKRQQAAAAEAKRRQQEQDALAAASRRDIAGVTGVSASAAAPVPRKKEQNKLVLAGVGGGVGLAAILGLVVFSHGHHATPSAATASTAAVSNAAPAAAEPPPAVVQPEPSAAPAAAVAANLAPAPSASPSPAMPAAQTAPVVAEAAPAPAEPSPAAMAAPEAPTPAAEAPATSSRSEPAVASKRDEETGREEERASARRAEEKKKASAAADVEAQRVAAAREHEAAAKRTAAAPEPKKAAPTPKPAAKTAAAKKPEPTPAPANRPSGPFILR